MAGKKRKGRKEGICSSCLCLNRFWTTMKVYGIEEYDIRLHRWCLFVSVQSWFESSGTEYCHPFLHLLHILMSAHSSHIFMQKKQHLQQKEKHVIMNLQAVTTLTRVLHLIWNTSTTALLLATVASCLPANGEDGQRPAGSTWKVSIPLSSSLTKTHTLVIVCWVPVELSYFH